jgi:hypothetical protein
MNVSWMSNPQYLAQVGHFFGALCAIIVTALFGKHEWVPILWVLAFGVPLATAKEFWFDIVYERDSFMNSLMDWGFYMLGAAVGVALNEWVRTG